ncbi:hypothetical protein AKJ16_DCAP23314 [Drosera capensis]
MHHLTTILSFPFLLLSLTSSPDRFPSLPAARCPLPPWPLAAPPPPPPPRPGDLISSQSPTLIEFRIRIRNQIRFDYDCCFSVMSNSAAEIDSLML